MVWFGLASGRSWWDSVKLLHDCISVGGGSALVRHHSGPVTMHCCYESRRVGSKLALPRIGFLFCFTAANAKRAWLRFESDLVWPRFRFVWLCFGSVLFWSGLARARVGPISIRIGLRPIPFGIGRGPVWPDPGPVSAGAAPMTKAVGSTTEFNW